MVNSTDKKKSSPDYKKPAAQNDNEAGSEDFAGKIRQPESDVSYITDNQIAGIEHTERRTEAPKK